MASFSLRATWVNSKPCRRLAIICLIIGWQLVGLILLYIAVALTIISLVDYLVQLSKSIKFN